MSNTLAITATSVEEYKEIADKLQKLNQLTKELLSSAQKETNYIKLYFKREGVQKFYLPKNINYLSISAEGLDLTTDDGFRFFAFPQKYYEIEFVD